MQELNEVYTQTAEPRVLEASRRLARAVVESVQFQKYEQANQRLRRDATAQQLLFEYQQAQQKFQMRQSWGGVSGQAANRIVELQEQVFSNSILKDYFQAQEDLVQMLMELNALLNENLGFDFASLAKPAGGCC
ncbi:MAG: YlbF family regulator [candidate division KSB1 bacterium]|nr:YlbF family regulator [candidate division KSB1 bacterium]MDZ7303736.1 YlbF family regulator [candidate division KSB1 bacterium]MDZ7313127.1 YlbF family regulator [candidate division KSB1 bacterium]